MFAYKLRSIMIDTLYITDLDKTWLRSDSSVSEESKEVWNILIEKGVPITYATARSYEKAKSLLKGHNFNTPSIVLNGAVIMSPEGEIISSKCMSYIQLSSILEISRSHGIDPFILGMEEGKDKFLYTDTLNEGQKQFIENRKGDSRLVQTNGGFKSQTITINFITKQEEGEFLRETLQKSLGEALEFTFARDSYLEGYYSLELLPPQVDKSSAIKQLCESLEIEPKNVVVFGDHHNDVGMFKFAGYSIAVQNAVDELKQLSDEVLENTNDEDGVSKYLSSKFQN